MTSIGKQGAEGTGGSVAREAPRQVEFKGDPREFFGIWITNLVFTILTLGIYSAWAAVRTRRYFYGNTVLDGHAFDYTAKPITILKGRAIAFAIILTVAAADYFISGLGNLVWLVVLPFIPWLLCLSLRFRARVTLWRNIRFHWRGSYGGVFVVVVLWPLVGLFSAGLLAPFAWRATSRYIAENLNFGSAAFATDLRIGPFYRIYMATIFGSLGIVLLFLILFLLLGALLAQVTGGSVRIEDINLRVSAGALAPLALLIPFVIMPQFIKAALRRPLLNGLSLQGGHRFRSTLSLSALYGVILSNVLVVIFTLGFAYPWAAVRLWRLQANAISILPAGSLDSFVDQESKRGDVVSSEFTELEGFEFGL